MSEFHDAVSTLLSVFAQGLSIIRSHKKRRSKEQAVSKTAPADQLSKSLKKNRRDVKNTYNRDLAQFGSGFASGDAQARSSLSTILSRLRIGLISIVEKFTTGRSTSSDYKALLDLSNSTRNQTIHTFEQLSKRLSSSSLALASTGNSSQSPSGAHRRHNSKRNTASHKRSSQNVSAVSLTRPDPVRSTAWVRRKPGRTRSSKSKSLTSTKSKNKDRRAPEAFSQPQKQLIPIEESRFPRQGNAMRREKRISIMSFASDSTKLGEIPEHKWARPPVALQAGETKFPVTTLYPLEPYQEPVRQRSRFIRSFKR